MVTLLAAVWAAARPTTYEVVRIERRSAFAGKLGVCVSERLTIRNGGETLDIVLEPYHTRCARPSRPLNEGDRIAVKIREDEPVRRADVKVL